MEEKVSELPVGEEEGAERVALEEGERLRTVGEGVVLGMTPQGKVVAVGVEMGMEWERKGEYLEVTKETLQGGGKERVGDLRVGEIGFFDDRVWVWREGNGWERVRETKKAKRMVDRLADKRTPIVGMMKGEVEGVRKKEAAHPIWRNLPSKFLVPTPGWMVVFERGRVSGSLRKRLLARGVLGWPEFEESMEREGGGGRFLKISEELVDWLEERIAEVGKNIKEQNGTERMRELAEKLDVEGLLDRSLLLADWKKTRREGEDGVRS